jgi:nicotinate-nucleotide adenylyltransferase
VREGILGGTFDPPHLGHLLAATDAFESLALDRLMFIPAGIQPLKGSRAVADPSQRLRMVELMVEGDRRFRVNPIEVRRPGPSYTIETLECLASEAPSVQRFFIVGADVLRSLSEWRDPEGIARLATIVVLQRGAVSLDTAVVPTTVMEGRRIDISSTEVRDRVRAGRPIRGFVPDAVADYITSERLYQ